ncbi:hypothetical protein MCUN1_003019 [Malassezia cuniculi]|uniref:Uncharacterized protein n=1 Tax=Malassezia cuniculi TaxID=948313 RepID=A0AAF0EVX8_9BASI|nr:hypothetical protein MCUN1_003019 [Malassezia cuniculi]
MPVLTLSQTASARLYASAAALPPDVRDAVLSASQRGADMDTLLSGASSADLGASRRNVTISHKALLAAAKQLNAPLDELLAGSHVYHAPPKAYKRPPELDASLAQIRLAHEKAEYDRITGATEQTEQYMWAEMRETYSAIASVPHGGAAAPPPRLG